MQEIIFGTTNPAKIAQVKGALADLEIEIKGLNEFSNLPNIIENGKTAQENASKKAIGFAKSTGKIVFSMDNALYLDGLNDDEQIGINVRKIDGIDGRPTDEQMIQYYSELVKNHGGEMTGHWEFAIAVANPEGIMKEVIVKTPTRYFKAKPSAIILKGYPLESIQVDMKTGKYISEMTQKEQDRFWQESVGKELKELFTELFENI